MLGQIYKATLRDMWCFVQVQQLVLVSEALNDELIEQIAGGDALDFCRDRDTFLLRNPNSGCFQDISACDKKKGLDWRVFMGNFCWMKTFLAQGRLP